MRRPPYVRLAPKTQSIPCLGLTALHCSLLHCLWALCPCCTAPSSCLIYLPTTALPFSLPLTVFPLPLAVLPWYLPFDARCPLLGQKQVVTRMASEAETLLLPGAIGYRAPVAANTTAPPASEDAAGTGLNSTALDNGDELGCDDEDGSSTPPGTWTMNRAGCQQSAQNDVKPQP